MRDKLLTYALVASIGVHLVVLGLVGKTSAAKPIEVEQLKIVKVDLVKTPDEAAVQADNPEAPKPKVVEPSPPEAPYVPPPSKMVIDKHPPKPPPERRPDRNPPGNTGRTRMAARPAANPGGALTRITAPNGTDMGQVSSGNTGIGMVPGSDYGHGSGSGEDPGIGSKEPDPNAHPGPGLTSGPEVKPPPPPPPKKVTVTVCSVSGMLPGPHCEKKESRSFREGSEPSRECNVCKAPEPKHVSTLADVSEPELIKDCKPKILEIDEPGNYTVKIHYTVNTNGSVSDIEITESSGVRAIDRAVVEAASKMRYKPAVQNGEPRSVKIRRTYRIRV